MKYPLTIGTMALVLSSHGAGAVTLHFDYSYDGGFFSGANQARRSTLEAAGEYFSQRLTDSLNAIDSGGVNQLNASIKRPDTGADLTLGADYRVAANTLTVYVGGRNLGGNSLGSGGPGGYDASGTQEFVDNVAGRGQPGALTSPKTDFAPWGGAIAFDADSSWYFDTDTATRESFSGFDFYSVAIHELGHVLGIGSANSWSRWVAGGQFTGPESTSVNGGNILLSADGGHWHSGQTSTVGGQGSLETAMDPEVIAGVRKTFTDLDWAVLKDIGWDVAAVPPPTAVPVPGQALSFLAVIMAWVGRNLIRRRD
ncbi:matrixin family metalloprotease [Methylococcus sp. EFPC2]|uniref:matrixin family metalloprotease n=1 Tax=Methylococcus sp. EFPC2 TaxID=2812648 RepID=UPI0019677F0F|nr:matrixin family metalloprotease [Methylococcus sp. EFPC2]QSA98471.1 matrixin family metalloprotease [Methylococcus sp. EFPC2]